MPQLGGLAEGIDQPADKRKKDRKLAYIAIGLGVVGVIIAWLTLRGSSGGGVTTTSANGTTGAGSVAGYTTDGSDASYLQAILQAVTGLQNTITPPAAAGGTPTGAGSGIVQHPGGPLGIPSMPGQAANPQQQQIGSGWLPIASWNSPVQDQQAGSSLFGQWFTWLSSPSALPKGATPYYEPTPGNFVPVAGAKIAPNTPQYIHR